MFGKRMANIAMLLYLLFIQLEASRYKDALHDQTSPRTNTLFDDADDIQRQLDNEARDRVKFGRPKTVWVFHFPTHFPDPSGHVIEDTRIFRNHVMNKRNKELMSAVTAPLPAVSQGWNYNNQGKWTKLYPECGGRSQSPVNLPVAGLIKARGARKLIFQNYDVMPNSMKLMNNRRQLLLFGVWPEKRCPLIYGGAAHSRRYLFHSLTLHWPSEHTVGGLQYPIESQLLFVSAEYRNYDVALKAGADPQAFLVVATLYEYSNQTHKGLSDILTAARRLASTNESLTPKPLSYFSPPFKEYVCYHGSLTVPPCRESVLWLVRRKALQIERDVYELGHTLMATEGPRHPMFRDQQPLNDRKVFIFK